MFRIFRKRETSSLLGRWGTVLEKQKNNDCDNSMDYMMCAVQSFSLHPKY